MFRRVTVASLLLSAVMLCPLPAHADTDPICAVAQSLVDADKAQQAIDVVAAAQASGGVPTRCADVLRAAYDKLNGQQPETTAVQGRESAWERVYTKYLVPIGKMLAIGLGTIVALLVLARVILLLVPAIDAGRPSRSGESARALGVLGIVVPMALCFAFPWFISWKSVRIEPAVVVCGLLGAAIAVWWARLLATRTRITIEASGSDDQTDTSLAVAIAACIRELGAEPPRGLEVPIGTDVDSLQGDTIKGLTTGWISTAIDLVRQTLGMTPWRVVVRAKGTDTGVLITRNGRTVASKVIETKTDLAMGTDDPKPALIPIQKMVAALILTTLAMHYAKKDYVGLAGATEWKSVGWTYAARQFTAHGPVGEAADPKRARRMLFNAIRDDPANLNAQIAFMNERYRKSTLPDDLARYLKWIETTLADNRWGSWTKMPAVRARLLHTATAVALNRYEALRLAATKPDEGLTDSVVVVAETIELGNDSVEFVTAELELVRESTDVATEATDAVKEPTDIVKDAQSAAQHWSGRFRNHVTDCGDAPLFERLLGIAVMLFAIAHADDDGEQLLAQPGSPNAERWKTAYQRALRADPDAQYDKACGVASGSPDKAVDLLDSWIFGKEDFDALMRWDPYLRDLTDDEKFTSAMNRLNRESIRSKILEIAPFASHKDSLSRIGYTTPEQIADTNDPGLAAYLRITPAALERLQKAAAIAESVPSELNRWRFELTEALWKERVLELPVPQNRLDAVDRAVTKHLDSRGTEAGDSPDATAANDIRRWLSAGAPG